MRCAGSNVTTGTMDAFGVFCVAIKPVGAKQLDEACVQATTSADFAQTARKAIRPHGPVYLEAVAMRCAGSNVSMGTMRVLGDFCVAIMPVGAKQLDQACVQADTRADFDLG
jgi:hypothetical protein